jgi:hypothetical protein
MERCFTQNNKWGQMKLYGAVLHPELDKFHLTPLLISSYVDGVLNGCLGISGPVWCHACFHVGRSKPDQKYPDNR